MLAGAELGLAGGRLEVMAPEETAPVEESSSKLSSLIVPGIANPSITAARYFSPSPFP